MNFVPSYIFGRAKLCACKDGRWGYLNPFQTLQEWSKEFAWAPLIPRKGKLVQSSCYDKSDGIVDSIDIEGGGEEAKYLRYIGRTPTVHETTEENSLRSSEDLG